MVSPSNTQSILEALERQGSQHKYVLSYIGCPSFGIMTRGFFLPTCRNGYPSKYMFLIFDLASMAECEWFQQWSLKL